MDSRLSQHLQANLTWVRQTLGDSPDLNICLVDLTVAAGKHTAAVIFLTELVDDRTVEESVLRPLQASPGVHLADFGDLTRRVLSPPGHTCTIDRNEALEQLLRGATLVLLDNQAEALVLKTYGGPQRAPDEPASEPAVRGARDGLVESLDANRSLIRRRLVDPALRFETAKVGRTTKTRVEIVYLQNRVDQQVLNELRDRLAKVETAGILDTGILAELIEDEPWSPFPQIHQTGRPDRICADLIAGRVAVLVDQSPAAMLIPTVFWNFLSVPEDYYERWWAATLLRLVRTLAVFVSFTLPALWVILSVYHQELLPTPLALSIAAGRERVPLPAALEALILEVAFEVLREASARLPRSWGQATSIVGGLVIGQAAVEAGLVSPGMVIIISMTGLASFATPAFSAAYSFRVIRFGMLILSGAFGVLGFGFGLVLLLLHLLHLKSFGVEYLSPVLPTLAKGSGDVIIRGPWSHLKSMRKRWWRR